MKKGRVVNYIIILSSILLTSCSSMKTIYKNMHISANDWTYPVSTKGMEKIVVFTESCKYDLKDEENQIDWNKLFGYSFGLLPKLHNGKFYRPVHWNSVRIGWRWNIKTEKIEICAYYYKEGVRNYPTRNEGGSIVTIGELEKEYKITIVTNETQTMFFLNDIEFMRCEIPTKKKLGWKNCLYFGGNSKSPHKIQVDIKKLK